MKPVNTQRPKRSLWHRFVTVIFVLANAVCTLCLIGSAYAGYINPVDHPLASAVTMTFPICLLCAVCLLAVTIFIRWRAAIISIGGMLVSMPMILQVSPFNLPAKPDKDAESFTIMTYNVLGLVSYKGEYPGGVNPTLSYILDQDADIVCLQELYALHPNERLFITPAQIDSLHRQYPYVFIGGSSQAILSKFPLEPINIGFPKSDNKWSAEIVCYRGEIHGHKITIFNVHLQSFALNSNDRAMFSQLTHLKGSEHEMLDIQRHLLSKISTAGPQRVAETEELIKYIKKYGGPNVIVCGDFNDVPGCYPLRLLEDEHLKQVYPELGFGPMITYNREGFKFRIDHILYRGGLRPLSIKRGNLETSDHYPLTTTFELTNN